MVGQSCDFLGVWDQSVVLFVNLVKVEVFLVNLKAAVSRRVVDDDCLVVAVVLHENRVQIVFNSKLRIVVVAWNDHAYWQFRCDLWQRELGFQSQPLFLVFCDASPLGFFIKWIVEFYQVNLLEVPLLAYEVFSFLLKLNSFLPRCIIRVKDVLNSAL